MRACIRVCVCALIAFLSFVAIFKRVVVIQKLFPVVIHKVAWVIRNRHCVCNNCNGNGTPQRASRHPMHLRTFGILALSILLALFRISSFIAVSGAAHSRSIAVPRISQQLAVLEFPLFL